MARGTPNTGAGHVTGDVFEADAANDLIELAATADDDHLFDLFPIDPPAAASATNVHKGYVPLRKGPVVVGSLAGRTVTVKPIRGLRSAISTTTPREILSALTSVDTAKTLPTAPAVAATWGLELLYAQIAYVDPTQRSMGTTLSLLWATSPAYASTAAAPGVAVLPADTSTTWNVPLAYVKNVNGQTTVLTEDIVDVAPATVSGFVGNLMRLRPEMGGVDARRAYSSANSSPLTLVTGGSSAMASGTSVLTSTITPAVVGRQNVEHVVREILIPKELTAGTGGVVTHTVIDDTRDWRGANFVSHWNLPFAAGCFHGEDDNGVGAVGTRQVPGVVAGGSIDAVHTVFGQTWEQSTSLLGTMLHAAQLQTSTVINAVAATRELGWLTSGGTDCVGLTVDSATGALRFSRMIAGAGAGSAIYAVLFAFFGNKRAL